MIIMQSSFKCLITVISLLRCTVDAGSPVKIGQKTRINARNIIEIAYMYSIRKSTNSLKNEMSLKNNPKPQHELLEQL